MKRYLTTIVAFAAIARISPTLGGEAKAQEIVFTPIEHASFVIKAPQTTIYVDPVGEVDAYRQFPKPDIILITHSHFDHFNDAVLKGIRQEKTAIIGPNEVITAFKSGEIINNGQTKKIGDVQITAVPAYNITKERLKFHEKGKGNGYVVKVNGKTIYISGDTEDVKEMRALRGIDYAFVCLNLPYTMTPKQAAQAVLEMRPKVVFPYHYREKDGFSDIETFKKLVGKNKDIEVRILKWYK